MNPKKFNVEPFDIQIFADQDIIEEFLKGNRLPSIGKLETMDASEFKEAVIEFRYRLNDPYERERFSYNEAVGSGTVIEFLKRKAFPNVSEFEKIDVSIFKDAVIAFRIMLNDPKEQERYGF